MFYDNHHVNTVVGLTAQLWLPMQTFSDLAKEKESNAQIITRLHCALPVIANSIKERI
jgi:plasmid maintenance system antidote protein VapI